MPAGRLTTTDWSASALLLIVEGHQPLPGMKPLA